MAGAKLAWREIRWLLFDALHDWERDNGRVAVKAVPLAFPVVEATHTLRERVPERIGLAHRYILEGLCRFGPCTPEDLDALLGLGPDRVERVLLDIERTAAGVGRQGRQFVAGPAVRQALTAGRFTREVTHRRKFVVNGLMDTLLPVDFWRHHEDGRLYPDPDRPAGPMRDAADNPTAVMAKVADRLVDGADDVRHWLGHADAAAKERVGVPAGACELGPETAQVRGAWVLSFLLVASDGLVDVMSASRCPARLVEGRFATRDYLARVCQGISPAQLEPDVAGDAWRKRLTSWPADTDVRPGRRPGEALVGVRRPAEQLTPPWADAEEGDAEARRLSGALVSGLYWDVGGWHVLRLVPADRPTAARVGLLRGVRALRDALREVDYAPGEKLPLELPRWWAGWLAEFARELPATAVPAPLPLEDLLRLADEVPDTEFLDKLEWLARDVADDD
jgi:hypothetical protein